MRGALSTASDAVLDWYWQYGVQRAGDQDLSGTWLDQFYQLRANAIAVETAAAANRPCLALWGPSQSGKSTLLSHYLDAPCDAEMVSALQWSREDPVAFVGRPDRPSAVHLNPYNQQRDASGCVTRFTLRREVFDPRHPVELRLASEEQVLHALAAGYQMECDTRGADGRETFHDAGSIDRKVAELKSRYKARNSPSRPVRERLQTVVVVLDDLIIADWARYRNLRSDWPGLRARLAAEPLLRSDPKALTEFAAWLFWDGQAALTDLWETLLTERSRLLGLSSARPIFCSYEAARLFLDIDAYRKLEGNPDTRLGYRGSERAFCLDTTLPNPLVANSEQFGLGQALVWEMTLPVNGALLPDDSAAARLLRVADLLDFPGVALSYPGGVRKKIEAMSRTQLLTEVLKRGKTASIVVTRSRQLGIDGFSILTRIQTPPAQPTQLLTGVQAWVRALGQPWPPPPGTLPINLVLTFAARLVNGVLDSVQLQRPSADFSPVFEFLNKLGDLANPRWVQFFTTTYPRFDEGCVRGNPAELEAAARLFTKSDDFRRHLGSCLESLRAMMRSGGAGGDGGNDYLLNLLAAQAQQSRVPALLALRARELEGTYDALLAEALPPGAEGEVRREQELAAWAGAIESAIDHYRREHPAGDGAAQVSQRLRRLLNVEPEQLEPIPLANQNPDWRGYLERQFLRWRELGKGRDGDWGDLGLRDAAMASRHLGYLAENAVLHGGLNRWLRDTLGYLNNHVEAAQARRFLAVRMAEVICFGAEGRPSHREFEPSSGEVVGIQPRLHAYAEREQQDAEVRQDRQSPHYLGFVVHFLKHLDRIKGSPTSVRKPQAGDGELVRIAETHGKASSRQAP